MSSSVLKGDAARRLAVAAWREWAGNTRSAEARDGRLAGERAGLDPARVEKEAHDRGFREGEAAGARKSLEQFQAAIESFASTASALAGYKPVLRAEAERELIQLSLAIARKILRRELSIDPNIILAVVQTCLRELENVEIYRLRLNPQDVPSVTVYFQQQRKTTVQIIPDPQVARGGAVFETAQGQLDARIETQLGEIERGLADRN